MRSRRHSFSNHRHNTIESYQQYENEISSPIRLFSKLSTSQRSNLNPRVLDEPDYNHEI